MESINKIKFPLFLIDQEPCDEFVFPNLFFYDRRFFDRKDLREYGRFYHNRKYVDINGNIYVSSGAEDKSNWIRKALGLYRKYYLIFEPLDVPLLNFEEVKSIYLSYLEGFKSNEAKIKHTDFANNCKTIKELL